MDSHGLFLPRVGILDLFQFGKIMCRVPKGGWDILIATMRF